MGVRHGGDGALLKFTLVVGLSFVFYWLFLC